MANEEDHPEELDDNKVEDEVEVEDEREDSFESPHDNLHSSDSHRSRNEDGCNLTSAIAGIDNKNFSTSRQAADN